MPARQRINFRKAVKAAALERALDLSGDEPVHRCEGRLADGLRCSCELRPGFYVFDHVVPDALGGRPTLENYQVLCKACDLPKTARDQGVIAGNRRAYEAHKGLTAPRKPMAGSRFSPISRGIGGIHRNRRTGALLPRRPGSIDVRDL